MTGGNPGDSQHFPDPTSLLAGNAHAEATLLFS
jgi:hypothetical protein